MRSASSFAPESGKGCQRNLPVGCRLQQVLLAIALIQFNIERRPRFWATSSTHMGVVGWWGGGVVGWWGGGWCFWLGVVFQEGKFQPFFLGKNGPTSKKSGFGGFYGDFCPGCVFLVRVAFFWVVVMLLDSCFRNKFDSKRPVDKGTRKVH